MTLEVRPFRNPDNLTVLNAIRKVATVDYQRRIPDATKANISDVVNNLLNNRPSMNEFIDVLVNRIGLTIVRNTLWTNPLAKFKRGMLEYGDTIEEINAGLLKAKRYDSDREYLEKDIFGQERPDVQASFHKVNRQDWYKVSINEALLRRAFLEPNGLSTFVTALLTAPTTSDAWDEYLLMTSLFKEYYDAEGFFKVNVANVSASTSTAADSKHMLRELRAYADKLKFISTYYNASGMPIAAQPDELELFITPEANAALDVEALAGAFQIDKARFPERVTVIPAEDFRIPGAQALLTTRDFFVVADQRIDTTSQINPVGLHTNYFLHHWQVISASRFVPAILFTTEESTVINIEETPVTSVSGPALQDADGNTVTTVERGGIFQVTGAAVTTPADGANNAVIFSLEGSQSPRTYITQTGTLYVAVDEAATSLTVQIAAQDAQGITATLSASVTGDLLELWPDPKVIPDADDDGLLEVTPDALVKVDGEVVIPSVTGVQYKKAGTNVANGSVHVISGSTAFTAVARSGYELAAGATASWTIS